jgi:DNA (cytosine-5)-methyltransferase 1
VKAASCFSGIGGAELALPEADWLWCAEIEPFPSAVLAQRFGHPNLGDVLAADFIDRALAFGPLDLLCGGPPCQAFSIAGNRLSMADPRGNLSLRFVQVAHAIRPRNLLVENVPGWLNTPDNAFGCFLGAIVGGDDAVLPCAMPARGKSNAGWKWRAAGKAWMLREPDEGGLPVYIDDPEEHDPSEIQQVELDACHVPVWPSAGMVAGPIGRAAWRVLDAQYAGLAQRRLRVFVVVDFGDGADPAAVLFERQGLLGNHPPRRETGEGVTGTLSSRAQGGGGLGTDFEIDGGQAPVCNDGRTDSAGDGAVSSKWAKGTGGPSGDECYNIIAHTLRAEGFDASEDGSGRGVPLVPIPFSIMPMNSGKDYKARETDVAQPIMAGGPVGGNQGGDYVCQPIAFTTEQTPQSNVDCALTLTKQSPTGGGQIQSVAVPVAIAMQAGMVRENPASGPDGKGWQEGVAYTLEARPEVQAVAFAQNQRDELRTMDVAGSLAAEPGMKQQTYVATQWAVRRLTVTECERLQGYPDGHTLIDFGSRRTVEPDMAEYLRAKGVIVEADNRTGKLKTNAAADGPRYKSLGNAWAVACVRPIALKIYRLLAKGIAA